ncbi:MAG: metallophosphoesterase [Gemmatimonadales bacterium]
MSYTQQVFNALDRAFDRAEELGFDIATDRYVIFSDQHRGQRDGADDFRRCERPYNAALGYYLEKGYTLVLLGDVEELWKSTPRRVVESYPHTLELEGEFHARDRYVRIYGNHDDEWASEGAVRRHLRAFLPGVHVHEGLRLSVRANGAACGTLLLVHGHQGTTYSDRHRGVGRFLVRHSWRHAQRLFRISTNTPARDFRLRARHETAMYWWAASQTRLVVIAGHTHRPVFMSQSHIRHLEAELDAARTLLAAEASSVERQDGVARWRARLEWAKALEKPYRETAEAAAIAWEPCYFNTGCCSFSDGNITGIEIEGGKIKLVRWPDHSGRPEPEVLATADLQRDVLSYV